MAIPKKTKKLETALQQKRAKALKQLRSGLKRSGFRKLLPYEVEKTKILYGLEFPDRVTKKNHEQEQYIFSHRDGYNVVVITSVINGKYAAGAPWVLITARSRRLWVRQFVRLGYADFALKILAYAKACRNVCIYRPIASGRLRLMNLCEPEHMQHVWTFGRERTPFLIGGYNQGLTWAERGVIAKSEAATNRHLKKTEGTVRRRYIRKPTLVTNPH